jgi:hypothetical protein
MVSMMRRSSVQTDRSTASRPRSLLQIFLREGIGWNILPGSARPSFEDATGYVSGARVTGRDISRQLGLPYIWADGIDMARSRVAAHGSEVVEGRASAPGWHKLAHDACSACATSGWVAIVWLSNGRYLVWSLIRQPFVVVRLMVHDGGLNEVLGRRG